MHLQSNDHSGLTFPASLLLRSHVRYPVYIVYENPCAADSCPGPLLIRIETEFAISRVLRLRIVLSGVIGLDDSAPGTMALDNIGNGIKIIPAQLVASVLELVVTIVRMHGKTGPEGCVCPDKFPFSVKF